MGWKVISAKKEKDKDQGTNKEDKKEKLSHKQANAEAAAQE